MSIPNYDEFMLPIMELLSDGKKISNQEIFEYCVRKFGITEEDKSIKVGIGSPLYKSRIQWALTNLFKVGLLNITEPHVGIYYITDEGKALLATKPSKIDRNLLKTLPGWKNFYKSYYKNDTIESPTQNNQKQTEDKDDFDLSESPEEVIFKAYEVSKKTLADELLARLKTVKPRFFEECVIDLLSSMGYGGSRKEAAQAIGRTGDGGIDGIISEDRLGLDMIYVQAKRWGEGCVGRPELNKFIGSLTGEHANKGIFITTSYFSADAIEYIKKIDKRVTLIDGKKLVDLMIEFNVGVGDHGKPVQLKRIDHDYFDESEQ